MIKRIAMNHRKLFITVFLLFSIISFQLNAQCVINGPYLIEPGDTIMTIRWELNKKGDYYVEYGKDTLKTQKQALHIRGTKYGGYLYEVQLRNLKERSLYFYRLAGRADPAWYQFRTFGDNQKKITFVAMGDSRSHPGIFKKIMEEADSVNPDFFISMGDLVESGGNYKQWHDFFFSVVKGYVGSIPIVSTLGDHEGSGDNGELFRYYLRKNQSVDKQWFSFDYGIAHFISLDYRHPNDKEMINWFIKNITSSGKKWNFVFMHRPSYNFGGHRSSWGKGIWPELFSKYHVDIVFAGHSHLYERFYPVRENGKANAVTYITTGGAGAGLYQSVKNKLVLAKTESVNHFVVIKIDGNKLTLKAIRMDGTLLDKMEIIKKKNGYNNDYEDQIISQDELNTITSLNVAISKDLATIPGYQSPAKYELQLQSYINQNIPFSVTLDKASANSYKMKPYNDTLKAGGKINTVLNITRTKPITISIWNEITPELRLKIIYEYNSHKDTITGKALDYSPEN